MGQRSVAHTTSKTEARGHVTVHAGPAQNERSLGEQRGEHIGHVAEKVHDLTPAARGGRGVLCRKNDVVRRMILASRPASASRRARRGNPITDSAAVEVMLSLFTLADHPGHSIAWFHLQNSPLQSHLTEFEHAAAFSRLLRGALLADGYGVFAEHWATRLAPACDRTAPPTSATCRNGLWLPSSQYARSSDFVARLRQQRVPDPWAHKCA